MSHFSFLGKIFKFAEPLKINFWLISAFWYSFFFSEISVRSDKEIINLGVNFRVLGQRISEVFSLLLGFSEGFCLVHIFRVSISWRYFSNSCFFGYSYNLFYLSI